MKTKDLEINNFIFRQRRIALNLSVRQLAEKSGVSRSTISNIENGNNIPDGINLLRLMFFFDLSKEEIALRK